MKLLLAALVVLSIGAADAQAAGWSPPQAWPSTEDTVARTAVADDGSAAITMGRELRVAAPGGRFGRAVPLKGPAQVAAAPGGAVAAVAIVPGGMYATVRTAAGKPWKTRKIASEGKDPAINGVAIAHDPKGGWVLVESRFFRPKNYLQAITLNENGSVARGPQSLGPGSFGVTARQTVSLAVGSDGRAVFAADTPDPQAPPTSPYYDPSGGASVFLRKHGEAFGAGTFLGQGMTDTRVAAGHGGRAAVVATKSANCGDAGCRGASALFLINAAGKVGSPKLRPSTDVKRVSGPSVALLGPEKVLTTWTHRRDGDGFSPTGTVEMNTVGDEHRVLDHSDLSSEPVAMPLSDERALIVWGGEHELRGAFVHARSALRISMPSGRGPSRYHFNSTNRDVQTAGSWAIVAWNTADYKSAGQIRVSLRRF